MNDTEIIVCAVGCSHIIIRQFLVTVKVVTRGVSGCTAPLTLFPILLLITFWFGKKWAWLWPAVSWEKCSCSIVMRAND